MQTSSPSQARGHAPASPARVFLGAATAAWLLSACASTHEITVDALAGARAADAISYRIQDTGASASTGRSPVAHEQAKAWVKTALSGKGLYEAPNPAKADLVVNLDYGINALRTETRPRAEPVFKTVPGRSRQVVVVTGVDANGNQTRETITDTDPPREEFSGWRELPPTEVVIYEKFLRLSARENQPAAAGPGPQEIWAIDATTEGESRNLQKYLPVLTAASMATIGQDTHGQKTIRLKDGDPAIAFVKNGL